MQIWDQMLAITIGGRPPRPGQGASDVLFISNADPSQRPVERLNPGADRWCLVYQTGQLVALDHHRRSRSTSTRASTMPAAATTGRPSGSDCSLRPTPLLTTENSTKEPACFPTAILTHLRHQGYVLRIDPINSSSTAKTRGSG